MQNTFLCALVLRNLQVYAQVETEEKGSLNNKISLKYNCKHAKICASKFMITALKPSTSWSCLKMTIQMVQVAHKQPAAMLHNFQSHPSIGQMFSHSWISAALSYWNLFKLNFIISRMGFLQSFQLSPSPSFARAQVRARRISRNFTAKNIYYLY